jgi:glucokinase
MNHLFSIGIDIGGTNTDIGLVNDQGEVIAKQNLKTLQYSDPQLFVDDLVKAIQFLVKDINPSSITGVGIGAPAANYYTGSIENATNLNMKGIIPLRDMIHKQFPYPVVVTNDANAATYGEMIYGGAKGMKNFMMFTLGTGVGTGIVIDGTLVYGHDGLAGEMGHAILIPEGRPCGCGNKGCLEKYTSSSGIVWNCLELMPQYPDSILTKDVFHGMTGKNVSDAAKLGDPLAIATYEKTGYLLGIALANAVTFSSPEAIFLMGGPIQAGDVFLDPIKKSFLKHKLFIYNREIPILISSLPENSVAILGAAALTR